MGKLRTPNTTTPAGDSNPIPPGWALNQPFTLSKRKFFSVFCRYDDIDTVIVYCVDSRRSMQIHAHNVWPALEGLYTHPDQVWRSCSYFHEISWLVHLESWLGDVLANDISEDLYSDCERVPGWSVMSCLRKRRARGRVAPSCWCTCVTSIIQRLSSDFICENANRYHVSHAIIIIII